MARARRLADEVRAGLNGTPDMTGKNADKVIKDPLSEISFNKPIRVHVREFGAIMGCACLVVAGIKAWAHGRESIVGICIAFAIGALFVALGYGAPRILHPVWKLWMKLAHVLSIVTTAIVLGAAWTLAFLPMALLLRILKIKVMDLTYKSGAASYWEPRDPKYDDFKRMERQF